MAEKQVVNPGEIMEPGGSLDATLTATTPPLKVDADGVARVGGTRVTLDTVIGAYQDGASPEEIVLSYDSLELADVHAVIAYYLRNRQAVEVYLSRRQRDAEAVRRENERRWPARDIRERLLARRTRAS
jgi:uncharacterized protein (DUF433 family)